MQILAKNSRQCLSEFIELSSMTNPNTYCPNLKYMNDFGDLWLPVTPVGSCFCSILQKLFPL